MANRNWKAPAKTLTSGTIRLHATINLGSSGAVSSYTAPGMTIAKTATKTGRYTLTLADKYSAFLGAAVTVQGADDAAYTTAAGSHGILRNVDVVTNGVLYVQLVRPDTQADAEAIDNAKVFVVLDLKNSSLSP